MRRHAAGIIVETAPRSGETREWALRNVLLKVGNKEEKEKRACEKKRRRGRIDLLYIVEINRYEWKELSNSIDDIP